MFILWCRVSKVIILINLYVVFGLAINIKILLRDWLIWIRRASVYNEDDDNLALAVLAKHTHQILVGFYFREGF
jgi:hypothetical protein